MSSTEWDLWSDQKAKTSSYSSKRGSVGSSTPAGLGLSQDTNIPNMSDSLESTGNFDTAVFFSGEDDHLASHSGGDARIIIFETGLSSLQASLVNISYLLISRLIPSLGTETKETLEKPWVCLPARKGCHFQG